MVGDEHLLPGSPSMLPGPPSRRPFDRPEPTPFLLRTLATAAVAGVLAYVLTGLTAEHRPNPSARPTARVPVAEPVATGSVGAPWNAKGDPSLTKPR